MMSDYIEEQALKWIKGSIEDPIIGTVSLENIEEKTKRAVETIDIKPKKTKDLTDMVSISFSFTNFLKEIKEEMFEPFYTIRHEIKKYR